MRKVLIIGVSPSPSSVMAKALAGLESAVTLAKAHVGSYTRKDGTFVKEHDDARKAAHAEYHGKLGALKDGEALHFRNKSFKTETHSVKRSGDKFDVVPHTKVLSTKTGMSHDEAAGFLAHLHTHKEGMEQISEKDIPRPKPAAKPSLVGKVAAKPKAAPDNKPDQPEPSAQQAGGDHPEVVKNAISKLNPDSWVHKDGKSVYSHGVKWGGSGHDGTGEQLEEHGFKRDRETDDEHHEIYRHPDGHVAHLQSNPGERFAQLSIDHAT